MKKETLLKARQIAERLGVQPITVRVWLKDGKFPNAKLEQTPAGDVWLVPESDVENFNKPERGRPQKPKK